MATFTQDQLKASLESRIEAWNNGDIRWNVSNQFEETVLESALEQVNEETLSKVNEIYNDQASIVDIAHFLSSFEAPEIDSAWIN